MAPFTTLQHPAMYAPIGSAVPMRRMAPMGGTIMVSNSAYPVATNYAAPFAPRRGTISVVQASKKNLEPAGGVGIAFEDRLDQRSGGMLKIVAEVFSEGAAADWNSTAEEDKKIHPGDLLVEVNGERVAGLDMHTLSTMVPGPVGTPVILRLRSVKENKEFEVSVTFAHACSVHTSHVLRDCEAANVPARASTHTAHLRDELSVCLGVGLRVCRLSSFVRRRRHNWGGNLTIREWVRHPLLVRPAARHRLRKKRKSQSPRLRLRNTILGTRPKLPL